MEKLYIISNSNGFNVVDCLAVVVFALPQVPEVFEMKHRFDFHFAFPQVPSVSYKFFELLNYSIHSVTK